MKSGTKRRKSIPLGGIGLFCGEIGDTTEHHGIPRWVHKIPRCDEWYHWTPRWVVALLSTLIFTQFCPRISISTKLFSRVPFYDFHFDFEEHTRFWFPKFPQGTKRNFISKIPSCRVIFILKFALWFSFSFWKISTPPYNSHFHFPIGQQPRENVII